MICDVILLDYNFNLIITLIRRRGFFVYMCGIASLQRGNIMTFLERILCEFRVRRLIRDNKDFDFSQHKEFKVDEEADMWGRSLCENWHSEFLELLSAMQVSEDVDPFEYYFGFGYAPINQILRGLFDWQKFLNVYSVGKNGLCDAAKELANKHMNISLMRTGFYLAPNTDREIVVFRQVPDVVAEELLQNAEYKELGFLGTSLIKERCINYCGDEKHLLKIYVPKNTRAVYANVVNNRDELEMLFPPDAILRLIKRPYFDSVSNKTIHEVKLSYLM